MLKALIIDDEKPVQIAVSNWGAGAITASSHRLRQSMEKMGSPACVNCILMSFSLI